MNARTTVLLVALMACSTAGAAAATSAQRNGEWFGSYPVRRLDPNDAKVSVYTKIPALKCDLQTVFAKDPPTAGFRGVLEAHCQSAEDLSKVQSALAEIDTPPPTHRFHVAVLAASRKDGPTPDLPASEAKALADFKKVMTYRSFQIEAETILQSDLGAHAQLNSDYELELVVDPKTTGGDTIDVRRFQLRGINPQVGPTGTQSMPNYIETSFGIRTGETLVLGATMSDQQARVVLVTALP